MLTVTMTHKGRSTDAIFLTSSGWSFTACLCGRVHRVNARHGTLTAVISYLGPLLNGHDSHRP